MSDFIRVERPEGLFGKVQVIRFDRPEKKNALTRGMYAAMVRAMRQAEGDERVCAHVFLGSPGAFCAGNDMQDFVSYAQDGALAGEVVDFLHALAGARKPMLAGVDGLAIGIGTTMQLHCDLTFATPRSVFRTPFVDLGLVPEAGSSLLAPRVMGHQRAFALLVAGEAFKAEAAREAGLVYRVVEEGELEDRVFEAAASLAQKPPHALAAARDLIRAARRAEIAERIDAEVREFSVRLRSEEARAAVAAFLERRK